MTFDDIATAANALHLIPLGGLHENGGTIVLLGPREPGFWRYVSEQSEFKSDETNPLDTWSEIAVSALARETGARAMFPFGGPPYHPFVSWALRSGEAWKSPVGLLVHKNAGLLVSYRGALQFKEMIELPSNAQNPCERCNAKPCLTACPVAAFGTDGYDVPSCKAHIDKDAMCRAACRVRAACPVSQTYPRHPAQTAFHMEAFHPS